MVVWVTFVLLLVYKRVIIKVYSEISVLVGHSQGVEKGKKISNLILLVMGEFTHIFSDEEILRSQKM